MATSFKDIDLTKDIISTKTLLHESIPITGAIVSGTYGERNIKNFSHGMFQSVYDYPYLSSSANHIFDVTMGFSANSAMSASANAQNGKKINIYNQMAQVLVGHDHTGSIREFDKDGDLTGGTKIREAYFVSFSRLLIKDEIKKGSFILELGLNADAAAPMTKRAKIRDKDGSTSFKVNSPAGEYGILYITTSVGHPLDERGGANLHDDNVPVGLLYYQAGVAVLTASIFMKGALNTDDGGILSGTCDMDRSTALTQGATGSFKTVHISGNALHFRNRIYNAQFNNTTELNSTIHYVRVNHNEFNYSANPTYVTQSKMRVKNVAADLPATYITTIGLYSEQSELLAVAKLSEPIKKTPNTEATFRVRLDY